MLTSERVFGVAISVLVLLVSLSGRAAGALEEPEEALRAAAVRQGRATFRTYCSSCHGLEGRGDGPIAEYLRIPPRDVTEISQHHDGKFPDEWVHEVIDGRREIAVHGTREMPVWGTVFQSPMVERGGQPIALGPNLATRRIRELVYFISSIQEPQASD